LAGLVLGASTPQILLTPVHRRSSGRRFAQKIGKMWHGNRLRVVLREQAAIFFNKVDRPVL
jgi:hypothetical protein